MTCDHPPGCPHWPKTRPYPRQITIRDIEHQFREIGRIVDGAILLLAQLADQDTPT